MTSEITLRDKLAVVTGASSGIGRAVALALAGRGARLALLGRDEARLREVADEAGGEGRVYAFDLTDDAALGAFKGQVEDEGPDILIHSAGTVILGSVMEASLADLDRQYRVNLRAPYALSQALLPGLITRRGELVFINSGAGLSARAHWSQYAATKHALKALADSLREEVADEGVRVVSVYPGRTASPMQEEVRRQEGAPYHAARFIQPEDVAGVVLHALLMPRSAAMTDVSVRPRAGG
ncbi:MAG: SDR family oxidoreductase [Deinococcota bacterium]|jgi:NADP-dependent 3-hydroxy acid dehydrogenase YdfG|nr:SDR family oxidoreductase [Deinococcota bacterium]